MTRRSSLRQRLQRQFAALALLPLFAVMAVALLVLLPALLKQGDERNFELATAIRDQVSQQLAARQRLALDVADDLARGALRPPEIRAKLRNLIGNDPLLLAAYVTDEAGTVEQVSLREGSGFKASDLVGLDQSSQPHFRAARASGQPVWSETFLSLLSGRITAVLVVPGAHRTLMVELALDGLSVSLAEIGRKSGTRAIILDRLGRVIGHPEPRVAQQQQSLFHLPLVRQAIQGKAGTERINSEGIDQLAHALPIPPLGWSVLVMQPTRTVLAPLITLGLLLAATVVVAVGLALLLARTFALRSGREVERLAHAADAAAFDSNALAQATDFRITEFDVLWNRLRRLFGDLHERDRQTDAARRDLQAVLDAATEVAIVVTDTQGLVKVFSQGAQKMLGHQMDDVVARLTPDRWHLAAELTRRAEELTRQLGHPIEGFEVLACHARHAGYEVRDWTLVRADGSPVEVSQAVTAMRAADGSLRGFLCVALDVSQRRRAAEAELARRAAEAASQAKTEFLSRMSHELRTPMNAVLGYAQLMEMSTQEPPTPNQRRQLQQVQRSGWHLVQLIDDVLDMARVESGHMQLTIEAVDIGPLVERAREIVAPLMRSGGVAFSFDTGVGSAAVPLLADSTRLVQVLVNLLSNAAKYNRPGGQVWLRCEPSGDDAVDLTVRDDGIGMDRSQLDQLFQPFNRLGRETSAVPGTGIGLVISRRLVELMGGTIQVDSEVGVGTTVTVRLRTAAPSADAAAMLPSAPAAQPVSPRGCVLYIEDNVVNATLMREMLRQRPAVKLLQASTLAEGLELAVERRPDLILLDLHLPDAQGSEALDRILAHPRTRDTPVVIVSADATGSRLDQMIERGATAYLTKPVSVVQMLATIDGLLGRRSQPGAIKQTTP